MRLRKVLRDQLFHEKPPLGEGVDIALSRQLGVSILHGDDTDAQVFGQQPFAGQLFPGGQSAGENVLSDAAVERFIEAAPAGAVKIVSQHGGLPSLAINWPVIL